jgi:hypothetical protein
MICSGKTSNFVLTPARSSTELLIVLMSVMDSLTSCAMSLSLVEMSTCLPSRAPRQARVPITSSASTPSTRSTGRPWARRISSRGSICERRSLGMGVRCALYSAKMSSRKVRPEASNTTAMHRGP